MNTIMTSPNKKLRTQQEINLISGEFSASEAADIITETLNVKINFHRLKRLSITEGNSDDGCKHDTGRINELLDEKEIAKDFFNQIRIQGKKIKMSSTINISVID